MAILAFTVDGVNVLKYEADGLLWLAIETGTNQIHFSFQDERQLDEFMEALTLAADGETLNS